MVTRTEKRRYFASVRKALRLVPDRKQVIQDLRNEVEIYLENNPDATAADLEAFFGTPEEITSRLVSEMDPDELSARMEKARFVRRVAVVTAIVLLVIFVATMVGIVIWNYKTSPIYRFDSIVSS